MRTDPPTGDEFQLLLDRITRNVLLHADTPLPAPAAVPRHRFRLGAVVVAALVVLGLGTAGGALALSLGVLGSGGSDEAPVAPPAVTSSPTPSASPTPTAPAPIPAAPTLVLGSAAFSPPDWGAGVTANVSGFAPDTEYSLSIDSRYRGESREPDGYFSVFSSPTTVMTDEDGAATVTWTPDVFPENFTGSGESGYLLSSQVRVDGSDGPQPEASGSGFTDPIALSQPLTIEFLPIEAVTATAPACIEPDQLVAGQPGLPVVFTGLLPGETLFVASVQTGGPVSYSFQGSGVADSEGNATIIVSGSSAEYPVSPSADIAPGVWQLSWSASFRQTPTDEHPVGTIPLTVGGC